LLAGPCGTLLLVASVAPAFLKDPFRQGAAAFLAVRNLFTILTQAILEEGAGLDHAGSLGSALLATPGEAILSLLVAFCFAIRWAGTLLPHATIECLCRGGFTSLLAASIVQADLKDLPSKLPAVVLAFALVVALFSKAVS
jgi:hypothetical protein